MKIQECKVIDNATLLVVSEDGKQGFFDVSHYFELEAFSSLKNPEEFKRISIGGYFIEWSSGADLSADTIEAKWFDVTNTKKKVI
ncbi:MAG: DUF2442 domain-containing protein [Cellvibrio sp.]|nr:DUF2442 domain-containing protein [Cellvibrio sp.]